MKFKNGKDKSKKMNVSQHSILFLKKYYMLNSQFNKNPILVYLKVCNDEGEPSHG